MEVRIKDFQSLEKAHLGIKGLTLLIGESSQGKSSCIKAIKAAAYNRFRSGQVRHGSEATIVQLLFDDHKFSVKKTPQGSPVMVIDSLKFSKLGRDVPTQVDEVLNMSPIEVGNDKYSLNFFSQFENPILMDVSQKKVLDLLSTSKVLDKHTKLTALVHNLYLDTKSQIKSLDALLDESKAKVSQLRFELEALEQPKKRLEELYAEWTNVLAKLSDIQSLLCLLKASHISTIELLISLINKINLYIDFSSSLSTISEYFSGVDPTKYDLLIELVERVFQLKDKLSTCNSLKELLSVKYPLDTYSKLESYLNEAVNVSNKLLAMDSINSVCQSLKKLSQEGVSLDKIIIDRVCPVCGSKVG